ncbi:hypothetical protein [Pseudohaliea rubra]|uniref:Uncharacterized protein n=1 Tax=Pseudohaliea rubra DSM 19751 TaxID=1265313 RepID=A0A095WWE7_9GAMM|nr:hypothetical protein [Pseudohaliea rubra]KGE02974.1 hypothetical protein HRUBRA_02412 [Pseudohaliea rubra DSM 19751]
MNKAPERQNTAPHRDAPPQNLSALWQPAEPVRPPLRNLEDALEHLPLEERFVALCQLAQAPSVFQRLAAYRWLAGLYLLDLRYEQRAKRIIAAARDREEGLARQRVEQLLRRC